VKLLLDGCVWGGVLPALEVAGHDVVRVADWPVDPGDEELLSYAFREGRILVTLDKDFGELAFVRMRPHSGIIRLVEVSAREQGPVCLSVLCRYGDLLERGGIVTVEPGRVRVRPRAELRQ
jgi:predicted nuclease of predicted toxin-antitoxin system